MGIYDEWLRNNPQFELVNNNAQLRPEFEYVNGTVQARTTPAAGGTTALGTGPATGVPGPTTGQGPYGMVPGQTTSVNPQQLYETIYPNLSRDMGTATANNASMMRGEIPDDVARNVWDRRAAQAASGGVSGSQFTGANTARDLGLTRLDLQNQGQTNFRNLLGTIYPVVGQTLENTRSNADLASAPDPAAAAAEQQRVYRAEQQNAFNNQQALLLQQFAQQQRLLSGAGGASQPREYSSSTQQTNSQGQPIGSPSYSYRYYR